MDQEQIPFVTLDFIDEDIVNTIVWRISELWENVKIVTHQILRYTGTYKNIDTLIHILSRYPYFTFWAFCYSIVVILPFIIIATLGLSTILLTFTGFIVLEGTVISIVSILLFGCIGALLLVLGFFGFVVIAGFFGFMYIYDLWDNANEKEAINEYINSENIDDFHSITSDVKIAVIEASISNADQKEKAVIKGSLANIDQKQLAPTEGFISNVDQKPKE